MATAKKVFAEDIDDGLVELELPNGGWWKMYTRISYGKQKEYRKLLRTAVKDDVPQEDLNDILLIALTDSWSFDVPVSEESLNALDSADMVPPMRVLVDKILPLFVA